MEQRQQSDGRVGLSGGASGLKVRDLGNLGGTSKPQMAPFLWRMRNFLEHKHRSLVPVAATKFMGRVMGVQAFLPSLSAVKFTPSPYVLGLDGNAWQRVQELCRQNVPIDNIATLVPAAEQWAKLQRLLRDNAYVPDLARYFGGDVLAYGTVSQRKVTTAGVNYLVDAWQNSVELENLKYHGVGTGTNAESNGDTALQTESTTALNPDSTRATGSLTEGASANIFRTVGTVTFDNTAAITEHGIFSQSATGGGTLWDRSVFSAINVASADSIQFTYDLTASAEA